MSFLDDPFDDNESGGATFETVAKVRFSPAYVVGFGDSAQYFAFDANSKEAQADAQIRAQESAIGDDKVKLGILMEMPLKTNLTAPESFTKDSNWFTPSWQNDGFLMSDKSFLEEDEKALVTGKMPYSALVDALRQFPHVMNEFVWMKTEQVINQYKQAKGDVNASGYAYRFYIPVEVYENEEQARAAAGNSNDQGVSTNVTISGVNAGGLSEFAKSQGWTLDDLKVMKDTIEQNLQNKMKGVGVPGGKKLSATEAVAHTANDMNVEYTDFNLIGVDLPEDPF